MQLVSKNTFTLATVFSVLSTISLASAQANNPQCGVNGALKCGSDAYLLVCNHGYWSKLSDCPKGTTCKDSSCVSSMSLDPEIYPSASSTKSSDTSSTSSTSSSHSHSGSTETSKSKTTTSNKSSTSDKSDTSDESDESDSHKSGSDDDESSDSTSNAVSNLMSLSLTTGYLVAFAAVAAAVPALGFF
ncbi:hypothetical protein GGF40_001063 [Coemansia sp. RSA 1286]|nr:hypothetical protein IWW45_006697 [Coemansia sp. RSA 485]KAJ2601708.1 hypothetical protein GGF39_001109 [Coemansia sp. RSA 1721]KAJ2639201.1 hypothetical protein GGF40_001063 [Coemansia sp. RSA 1286]